MTGRDEWTSMQWLRPLYQPADRPKSSGVDDMLDMRVEELMKTLIGSKGFDGRIIRFNVMQTCISWQQFRKVPTMDSLRARTWGSTGTVFRPYIVRKIYIHTMGCPM